MSLQGCDRECKFCPLFEICGSIGLFEVHVFRCPFFGCELKEPALKKMIECDVCRYGDKLGWNLNKEETLRLVYQVMNLEKVYNPKIVLPGIIPIVSLREPATYVWNSLKLDTIIVGCQELFDRELLAKVVKAGGIHDYMNFKGKAIISTTSYIGEIVKREMAQSGATNKRLFLREKGLGIVCKWLNKERRTVYVMVLKRFCKAFSVDPNELEQKGIILGPCTFPVDMRSDSFIKLKTHVHNEGRISSDAVSYINQDPVLIKYFIDAAKVIGMPITRQLGLRSASIEAYTCLVLGRALEVSGLRHGKKTKSNPSLDPTLMTNTGLLKYHMQATFTEEGWFYISTNIEDRRLESQIGWGRSVDITDKLSNEKIEMLRKMASERKKRKIYIGFIKDTNVRMVIRDNPPLALYQEVSLLRICFYKRA